MAFYASNFVYDSKVSSDYGLTISTIGASPDHRGANVELSTESLYRRSKVYLMGVQETPVLSLPVTITVAEELSATESSDVSKWLFGQNNYKKLQILQPDMQYVSYNCIFTSPSVIRVGNIIRGYNATIVCDSPFAWEQPVQTTYYYGPKYYNINEVVTYNNTSDSANYTYPIVEVTANRFGGSFSVINLTDHNRKFSFTGLLPDETLMIDNDLQIIQSTQSHLNRIEDFDGYQWFRLAPKLNRLHLMGSIDKFRIVTQTPKKIA